MEILLGVLIVIVLFDTLLIIGIAGSLARLIKSMSSEDQLDDRTGWNKIMRGRRTTEMQEGNSPSYADNLAMSPIPPDIEATSRGWDGIHRVSKNWDGLPVPDDE